MTAQVLNIDVVEKFVPDLPLNCMKFSQLFLGKIIEIGTTKCQILRQNASNLISELIALPRPPSWI